MDNEKTLENCPHCGAKLSPWQKVLLNVDRAIVCKNCWYRILLDTGVPDKNKAQNNDSKENDEKRGKNGNL
jgi:DNA-directed RNA polymerase subunit RPC12/RpoP